MVRTPLSALATLLLSLGATAYAEAPVIAVGPPPAAQDPCAPGRAGLWSQLPSSAAQPGPGLGGSFWGKEGLLAGRATKLLRFDPCQRRWSDVTGQEEWRRLAQPSLLHDGRSYRVDDVWVFPAPDRATSRDIFAGGTVRLPSGAEVPLPARGAPSPRSHYALAPAEGALIVWGGWAEKQGPVGDGAILDLEQPAWRPISMAGAPARRVSPVVAWTGQRLLIWGGADAEDAGAPLEPLADGARYDPTADRWEPMSQENAPAGRFNRVSAWTGRQLLVLSGRVGPVPGAARGATQGALYDPAADRWTPISGVPADLPEASWLASFVDHHGHVLLFGTFETMRLYFLDPARGALEPVDLPPQLKDRILSGIAWSGKRLFLWGGGTAVRSDPREPPKPPIPQVDGWVYEPR